MDDFLRPMASGPAAGNPAHPPGILPEMETGIPAAGGHAFRRWSPDGGIVSPHLLPLRDTGCSGLRTAQAAALRAAALSCYLLGGKAGMERNAPSDGRAPDRTCPLGRPWSQPYHAVTTPDGAGGLRWCSDPSTS